MLSFCRVGDFVRGTSMSLLYEKLHRTRPVRRTMRTTKAARNDFSFEDLIIIPPQYFYSIICQEIYINVSIPSTFGPQF
jgi:hypothetical protein